jgi:hypothetical protein
MSTEMLVLVLMIGVAVAWVQAMRMRERALAAAQRLCAAHDAQLLDQSVGLTALRLRRRGGLALECHYGFEVSLDGKDRHHGRLWLVGDQLAGVSTPWRDSAHVLAFAAPGTLPPPHDPPRTLH